MGLPTGEAGKQQLFPKPSGVSKPARVPPSLGKVKKLLKMCLKTKNFTHVPWVVNVLKSGTVTGDNICFEMLEVCCVKAGKKDLIPEFKGAKEKLSEKPQSGETSPKANDPRHVTSEEQEKHIEEEEREEEPEDPVDWVAKLESVVGHPKGVYETFVSTGRSQPKWIAEADNLSSVLRVRLRIRLDVSQSMRRRFGDEITGLGVFRYGSTDDTHEGSKIYNRAAKLAAKECFLSLKKIAEDITNKAAQALEVSLSEYLFTWRKADFSRARAKAYLRAKELILSDMHAALYGSKVYMYGSGTIGLALSTSDVDIALVLPGKADALEASKNEPQARTKTEVLSLLRRCVLKAKMESVCLIDTAKIPVLRYWDPEAKVDVDITLGSGNPILLSRFMRRHMQSDVRVWELCMCIKHWAKKRNLSGVFPGCYINSIGWTIMVIFFLQHIAFPSVASLFRIKGKMSNHCTIVKVPWLTNRLQDTNSQLKTSELLTRFFQFFGYEFDFNETAVSLNCQTLVEAKAARIDKNSAMFIEQPLVPGANVVGHVTTNSLERTLNEMRRGYFECLTAGDVDVLFKEIVGETSGRENFFDH